MTVAERRDGWQGRPSSLETQGDWSARGCRKGCGGRSPHHRHSLGCFRAPAPCVRTPWFGLLLLQPGGLWGVPAIPSTTPALYWRGQVGLTPATRAQPALSRQGAAGPNEARLVLPSTAPPCPQQRVTHLTTGSRAPGTRPRDLDVPWTLGGGGRGVSGVPMSMVGPVSEAPACTALRLSSSEGLVPRARGGTSVTRLGISPAHTAILQPLMGAGAGSTWDSQEAWTSHPSAPRRLQVAPVPQIFPEGGSTSSERPVPGLAKLCSGPRGA